MIKRKINLFQLPQVKHFLKLANTMGRKDMGSVYSVTHKIVFILELFCSVVDRQPKHSSGRSLEVVARTLSGIEELLSSAESSN